MRVPTIAIIGSFLSCFIFFIAGLFPVQAANVVDITKILSTNQGTYYQSISGTAANSTYVGVYNIKSIGSKLYFLWSKAVPDHEGTHKPTLSSYDGSNFTGIQVLPDDDDIQMKAYEDTLYIPGRDPTSGDDWDAGNLYTYNTTTSTYTKYRYKYGSNHYVDATTTDANGNYSFTNLKPSSYIIKVIKPADYAFTTRTILSGLDNDIDSDFDTSAATATTCSAATIGAGLDFFHSFTDDTYDAGLKVSNGASAGTLTNGTRDSDFYGGNSVGGSLTLGDKVWLDSDADGLQDNGELGIAGVRVELYTKDPYFPCVIHSNAFTKDSQGNWYFSGGGSSGQDLTTTYITIGPTTYSIRRALVGNNIFRSSDNGVTWTPVNSVARISEPNDAAYKNGRLYVSLLKERNANGYLYADSYLLKSLTGTSWSTHLLDPDVLFPHILVNSTTYYDIFRPALALDGAFVSFRDSLLLPSGNDTKLVSIDNGNVNYINTNISTLGDLIPSYGNPADWPGVADSISGTYHRSNSMAAVDDKYVYVIGSDNKIYLTTDLHNYTAVEDFSSVDSGTQLLSLHYWANTNSLVASTMGSAGSIYQINHSKLVENYVSTIQAIPNLEIMDADDTRVDLKTVGSVSNSTARIKVNGFIAAQADANFSGGPLNWKMVNADSNRVLGKSVVTKLNEAQNASPIHTLFVPIPEGKTSDSVVICPNATTLLEVQMGCDKAIILEENVNAFDGNNNVIVTKGLVDGVTYWIVKGTKANGGAALLGNRLVSDAISTVVATTLPVSNSYIKATPSPTPYETNTPSPIPSGLLNSFATPQPRVSYKISFLQQIINFIKNLFARIF